MIASKEDEHKQFIHILNDCGIDISDFRYDEDKKDTIISRELNGRTYELPYEEESDGTQKLFISLPLTGFPFSDASTHGPVKVFL